MHHTSVWVAIDDASDGRQVWPDYVSFRARSLLLISFIKLSPSMVGECFAIKLWSELTGCFTIYYLLCQLITCQKHHFNTCWQWNFSVDKSLHSSCEFKHSSSWSLQLLVFDILMFYSLSLCQKGYQLTIINLSQVYVHLLPHWFGCH